MKGPWAKSFFWPFIAIFTLSLTIRLLFLVESLDVFSLSNLIPGLDEDIYWSAARNIRHLPFNAINFELLSCSAPFHVIWLSFAQGIFGESTFVIKILHITIASFRYAFLWLALALIIKSKFGSMIVVIILALTPSLIVLDASLLKSVNDLNLISLLVLIGLAVINPSSKLQDSSWPPIVVGVLCSLSVLNQISTILFAFPFAALFLFSAKTKARGLAAGTMCIALPLVTYLVFSSYISQPPSNKFSMIPHSGFNLYLGTHPQAQVDYKEVPGVGAYPYRHAFYSRMVASLETGKLLSFKEADSYFRNKSLALFATDTKRLIGLFIHRIHALLSNAEFKGVHYIQFLKQHIAILSLLPFTFGILLLLATVGSISLVKNRSWPTLQLLTGLTTVLLLTNMLIFVFDRFKAPLYIPLAILGAMGIEWLRDVRKRKKIEKNSLIALSLSLTIIGTVTFWPPPVQRHESFMNRARANENLAKRRSDRIQDMMQQNGDNNFMIATLNMAFSEQYNLGKKLIFTNAENDETLTEVIRLEMWLGINDTYRQLLEKHPERLGRLVESKFTPLEKSFLQLL